MAAAASLTSVEELTGATRKTKKLAAGGLSGMISALAFQPLDVLRTQQQGAFVASTGSGGGGSALRSSQAAMRASGTAGSPPALATRVRSMWRGTSATLIRVTGGAALYFGSLDYLLALFPHTAVNTFLAGALARTFAGSVMSPLTVVKARMEWQAPGAHAHILDVFRHVVRDEGARGLYRGMIPTLVRDVPFSGLYVLLYTRLKRRLEDRYAGSAVPDYGLHFASGVVAGILATTVVHPADVVKTRMQLSILRTGARGELTNVRNSLSLRETVRRMLQDEGWRGFARGILPRVVKRTLSTAVTWTIYEQLSLR
jgi:solute carrier family 25 protein 38